jgi:para-nitrobenzyl esterase
MQRTWLNFATAELGPDWPRYDDRQRRTRVIRSSRDDTVADPDARRREAWAGLY